MTHSMGRAADPPSDESPEHSHLRIRPTDTELSPAAVEQGFCRLHTIEPPTEGWRDRLFGTEPPTIEFRLQRPAGADAELSLYAGIENAPQAALKEALRTACPNAYELTPATPEPVGPLADATNASDAHCRHAGRCPLERYCDSDRQDPDQAHLAGGL